MRKCLFIGSKTFGQRSLEVIDRTVPGSLCAIATIDDSADPRTVYEQFLRFAGDRIPIYTHTKPSDLAPLLKEYTPDIVFVCGWYWIIPTSLLFVPPLGFVGIHFSLLPKYRGGAPVVWAMINGEEECGFSLFRFDKGMDSGPLFAQQRVAVGKDEYISDILKKIEDAALSSIEDLFPAILQGKVNPAPQISGQASYGAQRLPEDGKINWQWGQQRIYNFIRAQSRPYPGAYTLLEGKRLHIWRVRSLAGDYYGMPGQVAAFEEDNAIVVCGDNKTLLLEETSLDGVSCTAKGALESISRRLMN